MLPPSLQIYLHPHVISTFDLRTQRKLILGNLCQLPLELVHAFSKYDAHKIDNKQTDKFEDIIPLTASHA